MMHNLRNTPRNYDYDSLQIALSNKRLVNKVGKMNFQIIRLKSAYNVLQDDFTEVQMKFFRIQMLCFFYTTCLFAYIIYTFLMMNWDPDLTHVNYVVEKARLFWGVAVNALPITTQRDDSL